MKFRTFFAFLAICFFSPSLFAQHSLQIDDGAIPTHYSTLTASNPGGIYTLPPGGGTLLTTNSLSSQVWLLGGNLGSGLNNQLGTLDATSLQFVTGGVSHVRMSIDGSGIITAGTASAPTTLKLNGGLTVAVKSVSAAYTALTTDYIIIDNASSAANTVTLPAASNKGQIISVIKSDATANGITLSPAAGDNIIAPGCSNLTMTTQGFSLTLVADGTSTWYLISQVSCPAFNIIPF